MFLWGKFKTSEFQRVLVVFWGLLELFAYFVGKRKGVFVKLLGVIYVLEKKRSFCLMCLCFSFYFGVWWLFVGSFFQLV